MGEHFLATNDGGAFSDDDGLDVEERWVDRVVMVVASGAVDMRTAPLFADAINVAAAKSPSAVIIDLTAVHFLASAGLSALVAAHTEISPRAPFGVVAHGDASRPITMLRLDTLFTLYRTLDDALHDLVDGV